MGDGNGRRNHKHVAAAHRRAKTTSRMTAGMTSAWVNTLILRITHPRCRNNNNDNMPTAKQLYHGRAGVLWNGTLIIADEFGFNLCCVFSFLIDAFVSTLSFMLPNIRNRWSCLALHSYICRSLCINPDATIDRGNLLEVLLLLFWLALRR